MYEPPRTYFFLRGLFFSIHNLWSTGFSDISIDASITVSSPPCRKACGTIVELEQYSTLRFDLIPNLVKQIHFVCLCLTLLISNPIYFFLISMDFLFAQLELLLNVFEIIPLCGLICGIKWHFKSQSAVPSIHLSIHSPTYPPSIFSLIQYPSIHLFILPFI